MGAYHSYAAACRQRHVVVWMLNTEREFYLGLVLSLCSLKKEKFATDVCAFAGLETIFRDAHRVSARRRALLVVTDCAGSRQRPSVGPARRGRHEHARHVVAPPLLLRDLLLLLDRAVRLRLGSGLGLGAGSGSGSGSGSGLELLTLTLSLSVTLTLT